MFEFPVQNFGDSVGSSVNDTKCSNAIVSKFKNELVFSGAYCQTNCKPETMKVLKQGWVKFSYLLTVYHFPLELHYCRVCRGIQI